MASEEKLSAKQESSSKKVLLDPTEYTVIHNRSEDDETSPSLECQFEEAVEKGFTMIVIEPVGLGDNSIKWIRLGNFLHKSAVLSSLGTLIITPFIPIRYSFYITIPLGIFGVSCACVYGFSWQFDPCCKYQVDYRGHELTRIPSHDIQSPSPVVLIRKNDKYRKILHNTLSVVMMGYIGWTLYSHFYL